MDSKNLTGIHCKVIWNDQIRRFQFSGTEFSSLQDQVKQLLCLNYEFVLKYKDNEDDMITVSSTEELACAIDISKKNGGLIRFTVFTSPEDHGHQNPSDNHHEHVPFHHHERPHEMEFHHHHEHGRDFHHQHEHGRDFHHQHEHGRDFHHQHEHGRDFHHQHEHGRDFHHQHEHGRDFHHQHEHVRDFHHRGRGKWGGCWQDGDFGGGKCQKNRLEKKKAKLTMKRDMFKAYLNSLDQVKELSPEEEKKRQIFLEKVNHLDQLLASFDSTPDCPPKKNDNCHFEKKLKKQCKQGKYKKEAKDSFLSEEAKAEIKNLRSQIQERKTVIWAIHAQIKEKKMALKQCVECDQPNIQLLKKDIKKLKLEKKEKKAELAPLCQRRFQLKTGNKF